MALRGVSGWKEVVPHDGAGAGSASHYPGMADMGERRETGSQPESVVRSGWSGSERLGLLAMCRFAVMSLERPRVTVCITGATDPSQGWANRSGVGPGRPSRGHEPDDEKMMKNDEM